MPSTNLVVNNLIVFQCHSRIIVRNLNFLGKAQWICDCKCNERLSNMPLFSAGGVGYTVALFTVSTLLTPPVTSPSTSNIYFPQRSKDTQDDLISFPASVLNIFAYSQFSTFMLIREILSVATNSPCAKDYILFYFLIICPSNSSLSSFYRVPFHWFLSFST